MSQRTSVMVFGVFDGFHQGHQYFLSEAKKLGQLTVVVARNVSVAHLKNRKPVHALTSRIREIQKEYPKVKVIAGDSVIGSWNVIQKEQPDIIVLGYDQKFLGKELKKVIVKNKLKIIIKTIKSYKPKIYHSRLLRKKLSPKV